MAVFDWLESTPVATWVGESLWVYPFLLSLHVTGLAIVVGIFGMLNLRLLGSLRVIPATSFLPLIRLAWIGLLFNVISGLLLFTSQAYTFAHSTPFLLKIVLIVLGAGSALIIQTKLRKDGDAAAASAITKAIASLSLLFWTGAIVSGRLIAYL